jgi:hypothetical protein
MTKKTTPATTTGKDIAVKADASTALAVSGLMDSMEEDAEQYRQVFDRDMLTIPRIKILQDLSPEVKETKAEYIPGARPGMICNEQNNKLDSEILFVPSTFEVRYIAWRPRKDGSGLVDANLTLQEVEENFQADGIGSWIGMMKPSANEDPVRVEVAQTPEYTGYAMGKGWGPMPVAISMPSTKVKAAKKINTTVELTRVESASKPGTFFRPAMFYHQFQLKTGLESGNDNEWFGFVIHHLGVAEKGSPLLDDPIYNAMVKDAKELKIALETGKARVDDTGLEK